MKAIGDKFFSIFNSQIFTSIMSKFNSFPGTGAYMRQFLRPAAGLKKSQFNVEADPRPLHHLKAETKGYLLVVLNQ